ncbi:ankyrin repeat domain-containing protein [Rugamonas apoptosis]|uniref:Ankyrin repeat domain-containing protein n=1 Tax=Rugamonas apoptosis TaxID=2758570 RepID=A0A7W2FCJ4_9BURK|nr:ankyrin repeat domain-containing protein [Rugamonas apoptosis]MBA5689165.1 ankyrin repeat domain-containing protein [Rugamonas apoptosis]
MTEEQLLPPYPRMGEIFRILALAFDTKAKNRSVDRYAREGDVDWALPRTLLDELFYQPLCRLTDTNFAQFLCDRLWHFHRDYMSLVVTVPLDSLLREDALQTLIDHFFVPHGAAALSQICKRWSGPDLTELLGHGQNAIEIVFRWLSPDQPTELAKQAYPESTGSDRPSRELVQRWIRGTQLPDFTSMKLFLGALAKNGESSTESLLPHLRRWLLIARALEWLEQSGQNSGLKAALYAFIQNGYPVHDIGKILSDGVQTINQRFSALIVPGLTLGEQLRRTSGKLEGDKERCRQNLQEFERLLGLYDPEGRSNYALNWFQGRWHVLSGDTEAALPFYRKAVGLASYRAGPNEKEILKEAMALAGLLGDIKFIRRLKHLAIALQVISPPSEENAEVLEDWEVEHFHDSFHGVFPTWGLFPEALDKETGRPLLPVLLIDEAELDIRVPDLRNPDRTVKITFADGQTRRHPQLRLFASFGRAEAVKALIVEGADVNLLDSAGGSALLCAIQHARQSNERHTLDLLLAVPHSTATLNSLTDRKRLSPLFEAIDYCKPEVVAALLTMGADPNLRGNISGETPLYYCIGILGKILSPKKTYERLLRSATPERDALEQEALRRYRVSMAGIFGDQDLTKLVFQDQHYLEIFHELVKSTVTELVEQHPESELILIAELLLKNGANPNAQVGYPVKGRTPLMLAAESNSVGAFDLILRHGGNPFLQDIDGLDSMQVARAFGAVNVLRFMQNKGII